MARNFIVSPMFDLKMKNHTPLIPFTALVLVFAGCSKHSSGTTSTHQIAVTNATFSSQPLDTNHFRLVRTVIITNTQK
jgi:hypothetical protein